MKKEDYSQEARKTIEIIEKEYRIDWNDKEALNNLTKLYLDNNQITDITPLKDLKNLTTLDLNYNQITNITPLKDLKNLTKLYLDNNQITDITPLKDLKNLTTLNLDYNQITDITILKDLTNLIKLYLTHNQITDITILKDLTNLTYLSLDNNQITDITPLKDLKNLTTLDLIDNKITDITPLKDLKNLTTLNLDYNQITDITILKDLTNLIKLYLTHNQITDITILKDLTNLTYLSLDYNKITDITPLKDLKNLTNLDLRRNQITDITPLKDLKNLTELKLHNNQITDITPLKDLIKLKRLDLDNNKIKFFPKELLNLNLEIKLEDDWKDGIILQRNPIEEPPMHIMKQGNQAIQRYFDDLEKQGRGKLNEAKLIIVGEPEAGKSSLMECLLNPNYRLDPDKASTMGIDVKPWHFNHPNQKEREMRANIWDFGGQEVQHMTHQFFLTPDSLYVLVTTNDRKSSSNFPYWFQIIHLLGEINERYSPVLVVKNKKSDEFHFDFDEAYYRKRYPQLQIEVREVNLGNRQGDFQALQEKIQEMISKLPLVNDDRPAKWSVIREDLEKLNKNHINFDEYAKVCAKHEVSDIESQKLLSGYLHSIGSLLHFVEDISLRDFIILSPQWAVDAVYSVVSDTSVRANQGRFNQAFIDRVWHNYSPSEQTNLLQLMKKDNFEICYPLANDSHTYIAPQLLPDTAPKYLFDSNDTLKFRFRYQFMPKGIIARLIVRLNEYIQDSLVWNKGVVLKDKGCLAQIIEEEESIEGKIIDIQINGNPHHRKFLLHTVCQEIESIHDKWFKNIQSEAMIPCNCSECKKSEKPYYFDYSVLQRYQQKGKPTAECQKSTKDVDVLLLLEGVFLEKESRKKKTLTNNQYNTFIQNFNTKESVMKIGNINGNVNGDFIDGDKIGGDKVGGDKIVDNSDNSNRSISIGGNSSGVVNSGDSNTITQTITTTNNDLKELLEKLQVEANNVVEALPTEEAKESFKDDIATFMEKTQENKLDKYFKVSKDGLLEATEAVGEVGIKAMKYIKQIVGLLG